MRAREKRAEALPAGLGILAFVLAFAGGAASKFVIKPSWAEKYVAAPGGRGGCGGVPGGKCGDLA